VAQMLEKLQEKREVIKKLADAGFFSKEELKLLKVLGVLEGARSEADFEGR